MKKRIAFLFLMSMAMSVITFAEESGRVLEGRIDLIEQDSILMGQEKFPVIYPDYEKGGTKEDRFAVECWVVEPTERHQIDFMTLVHVGYAHKARVTLTNGVVSKIEILEMHQ